MGARAMQVMRRTVRPVSGEQSGGGGGASLAVSQPVSSDP